MKEDDYVSSEVPEVEYDVPETAPTEEVFFRDEVLRATEKLVKDELVDEKLKEFDLWPIISKTMKLTFIDERDSYVLRELIESEFCRLMRSKPPCELNQDFFRNIGNARIIALLNINRAKGTYNRNLLNERTALISQFRQIVTSTSQQRERPGLFSRFFGGGSR